MGVLTILIMSRCKTRAFFSRIGFAVWTARCNLKCACHKNLCHTIESTVGPPSPTNRKRALWACRLASTQSRCSCFSFSVFFGRAPLHLSSCLRRPSCGLLRLVQRLPQSTRKPPHIEGKRLVRISHVRRAHVSVISFLFLTGNPTWRTWCVRHLHCCGVLTHHARIVHPVAQTARSHPGHQHQNLGELRPAPAGRRRESCGWARRSVSGQR